MRRMLIALVLLLAGITALAMWLTRAEPVDPADLPPMTGNAASGRMVFLAAGCATCHGGPGAAAQARPVLAGGRRLTTQYGTFVAPNISPDVEHGIGRYDLAALVSVLHRGVTPEGRQLYPVMPYTSYVRMKLQDIADLKAYLDQLPASDAASQPHELALPWSLRQFLGLWNAANLREDFVGAAPSEQVERGRYLVEALGHCAECHTPRDRFGGLERHRWMGGSPAGITSAEAPNLTPAALDWTTEEIVWYLESGHGPQNGTASHEMADIVAGLGQLPRDDLAAIAAYLEGLAPVR